MREQLHRNEWAAMLDLGGLLRMHIFSPNQPKMDSVTPMGGAVETTQVKSSGKRVSGGFSVCATFGDGC